MDKQSIDGVNRPIDPSIDPQSIHPSNHDPSSSTLSTQSLTAASMLLVLVVAMAAAASQCAWMPAAASRLPLGLAWVVCARWLAWTDPCWLEHDASTTRGRVVPACALPWLAANRSIDQPTACPNERGCVHDGCKIEGGIIPQSIDQSVKLGLKGLPWILATSSSQRASTARSRAFARSSALSFRRLVSFLLLCSCCCVSKTYPHKNKQHLLGLNRGQHLYTQTNRQPGARHDPAAAAGRGPLDQVLNRPSRVAPLRRFTSGSRSRSMATPPQQDGAGGDCPPSAAATTAATAAAAAAPRGATAAAAQQEAQAAGGGGGGRQARRRGPRPGPPPLE